MLFHNFSGFDLFISYLCVLFPSLLESNTYYVQQLACREVVFPIWQWRSHKMNDSDLTGPQSDLRTLGQEIFERMGHFGYEGLELSISCFQFSYTHMNIMFIEMLLLCHGLIIQVTKRKYVYCSWQYHNSTNCVLKFLFVIKAYHVKFIY
jgi:hypothetical protein